MQISYNFMYQLPALINCPGTHLFIINNYRQLDKLRHEKKRLPSQQPQITIVIDFSNYLSSIKSAQSFGIVQLAVSDHATQLCGSKGLHADEFVLIGVLGKLLQSPGLI